jgi:hypothetical protein
MYPHERSLVTRFGKRPFVILGVNSDRDLETIRTKAKEQGLTWRSWFDGGSTGGPIATKWNVQGWPTCYLIDHEGVIRAKGHSEVVTDEAIEKLVAEAEAAAH